MARQKIRSNPTHLPVVALIVTFVLMASPPTSLIYDNSPSQYISGDAFKNHSALSSMVANAGIPTMMTSHSDGLGNETATDIAPRTVRYCDTHNSTDVGPCIFDIGLNTGQDTMQYLASSSTSRVVAIEANPTLIDAAKKKFRGEIAVGRLELVNIGLVGNETESGDARPKVTFWINKVDDVFSSFRQDGGCRGPGGVFLPKGNTTFCRKIEMDTISCAELIKQYGTPYYMKVDIEGMDRACVQSLGNIMQKDRPKYISKENVWTEDVEIFTMLGYKKFKVVNQNVLQTNLWGTDLIGHSGPWGEDAEDLWKGKNWQSREELLARLPLPEVMEVRGKKVRGWYDLHGRK